MTFTWTLTQLPIANEKPAEGNTDALGNNESLVEARDHGTGPDGRSQNSDTANIKLIHILYSILLVAKGWL